MIEIINKNKKIDILIIAEGTYPYIRGGVSSWIHELVSGLSDINFGVVFLGSRPEDYGEIKYKLPENIVYLSVSYIFDYKEEVKPKERNVDKEKFKYIEFLHNWFKENFDKKLDLPDELKDIRFFIEDIKHEDFLFSREAWDFIINMYAEYDQESPFIDYFWNIRNMHAPIWTVAKVASNIPDFGLVHSPSTGYAGFLASLLKYHKKKPFILTEHGIYTKERKIDLMHSDWLKDERLFFQRDVGEVSHIKNIWIKFFESIGRFIYHASDLIISLFDDARKIQISYDAPEDKCIVIPNGVDVDGYALALEKRPSYIPKVITLLGRVVPIKDIKTFIKAMRIVVNNLPDVEGWIVGPTDEDPNYYQECLLLVKAYSLEENVKFLGFQNPKDIFPKTGILTLTSISEGMPLVVLEGFAAGLPAVTTDVGSCRQLIYGGLNQEDLEIGEAGEVVPIANPELLSKAYISILTDENLWRKYQLNALKRVNRFYRKDQFLNNYKKIYQEVLKSWQE